MGKDVDGACCDACRRFGGDDPEVHVAIAPVAIAASYSQVRIVVRDRDGTREFIPTGPVIHVGRTTAGNDIVVRDSAFSKRQLRILVRGDRVIVEDAQSGCGTYVDGRKITAAELREGSVIHAGDSELRVVRVP